MSVTPAALAEQFGFFHRRGYTALTFAAAEDSRRSGTLPEKALVVTFDDAFASVLLAVPLLERLNWTATVFAVTDFASSGRPLEWHGLGASGDPEQERLGLDWPQLRGLDQAGWEIGSHTRTHRLLPNLTRAEIEDELAGSRDRIVQEIGNCRTLAYPYGVATEEVGDIARSAGYAAACTLRGTYRWDEPMLRPRIRFDSTHTGLRIRLRASEVNRRLRKSRAAQLASSARRTRGWLPPDGAR